MAPNIERIAIRDDYITLGQFLKKAAIISNGGEAKFFLATNKVVIDGQVDQRRGRKLYPGMEIETKGRHFLIINDGYPSDQTS